MRPEGDRQKSAPCGTRIGCKQDPSPSPTEADDEPGYPDDPRGESGIPRRGRPAPLPRVARRGHGRRGAQGREGPVQRLHLRPDRDPLPVPLAGDRPRSFVPRLGGPVDRLARVPGASSVWRGDRHLLRCPQAPAHGRRPPAGPRDGPPGRGRGRRILALERSASLPRRRHDGLDAGHAGEPGGLPSAAGAEAQAWGSRSPAWRS